MYIYVYIVVYVYIYIYKYATPPCAYVSAWFPDKNTTFRHARWLLGERDSHKQSSKSDLNNLLEILDCML